MSSTLPPGSEDVYLEVFTSLSSFKRIDTIESYSTSSHFADPMDTFTCTMFSADFATLRTLTHPLAPLRFYIAGRLQFRGRIDTQEIQDDGTITITARSYLAEMADCHLDPKAACNAGTTLNIAVLRAAKAVDMWAVRSTGFREMRYILTGFDFNMDPEKDFTKSKTDYEKALHEGHGEGIYEWADRLCKRQGFLIQAAPNEGQISLCRPEYRQPPIYHFIRSVSNPNTTNMLTCHVKRDYSRVPTYMEVYNYTQRPGDKARHFNGKIDVFNDTEFSKIPEVSLIAHGNDTQGAIAVSGRFYPDDNDAQPNEYNLYKAIFSKDEKSKTGVEIQNHMMRELAERTKDTLVLTVTLQGHRDPVSKYLYGIDTIALVDDELGDVHENMWVESRTFSYAGSGQQTTLTLVRPNSFIIGED